jgi:predicted Zn-dependent protease
MTLYLLGDIHLQQNKLDSAQQYLSQALKFQPGLIEAQLDVAKTYQAQGRVDEAVNTLKAVVTSDAARQDAHYLLFHLYKERGQMEDAKRELQIFEALKRKAADEEQKRMRLDSLD